MYIYYPLCEVHGIPVSLHMNVGMHVNYSTLFYNFNGTLYYQAVCDSILRSFEMAYLSTRAERRCHFRAKNKII